MAEHLYEAALTKTTGAAAAFVCTIVPATLAAGVPLPEIREIGIYNHDGTNAAEVGLGIPAAAGTTPSGAVTVQRLGAYNAAGNTTLVPTYSGAPTAPTNYYRRAQIQAIAGAGTIWVWGQGEFPLWSGATINQVVIWQISALAVQFDIYVKICE